MAPVLVLLLAAAATAVAGAAAYVILEGQKEPRPMLFLAAFAGHVAQGGLTLTPVAGEPLPAVDTHLAVGVDGGPLATVPLASVHAAPAWTAGVALCIVGPDPGCVRAGGATVRVRVVAHHSLLFDRVFEVLPFRVQPDGSIAARCATTATAHVLGTAPAHGRSGPPMPVGLEHTLDGGATLVPLLGGAPARAGDQATLEVPAGARVGLRGHAPHGSADAPRDSFGGDPRVRVLRDGDAVPPGPGFASRASLAGFLQPYVDVASGTVALANHEVLVLWELGRSLDGPGADFQDAAVLLRFPRGC